MSDVATDRPLKSLTVQMTERQFRTSQGGMHITTVIGEETPGKKSCAVLFAEHSDSFQEALGEYAETQGIAIEDALPNVTFNGYWKKRDWTGNDGNQRTTWEFHVRGFKIN